MNQNDMIMAISTRLRAEFTAIQRVMLALKERAALHPIIKGRMRRVEEYRRILIQQLGVASATMVVNTVYTEVIRAERGYRNFDS